MTERVYYIDLYDSKPVVSEYEKKYLNQDLREAETSNVMDLDDVDWRIFTDVKRAHDFLANYLHVMKHVLPHYKGNSSPQFKHMLYKRRYLVQTLMGLKPQTFRNYYKPWQGEMVNLHDQIHFLPVRVTKITQTQDNEWRYDFELGKLIK